MRGEPFKVLLSSLDKEDSCCSVTENERQHGKMRLGVKWGSGHKSLPAAAAGSYLGEWKSEADARRPSDSRPRSSKPTPKERLRSVLAFASEVERELAKDRQRIGGGGPKLLWAHYQLAQEKLRLDALGERRNIAEYKSRLAHYQNLYDQTADDDADKRYFIELYERKKEQKRIGRECVRSDVFVEDTIQRVIDRWHGPSDSAADANTSRV